MTSRWFFLSTLNYDARSTTHPIGVVRRQRVKEMPGSVASGIHCISEPLQYTHSCNTAVASNSTYPVQNSCPQRLTQRISIHAPITATHRRGKVISIDAYFILLVYVSLPLSYSDLCLPAHCRCRRLFLHLSRSMIPLDGGSARHRGVFMHKHNTLTRYRHPCLQTGFEPATPASELPQNHA